MAFSAQCPRRTGRRARERAGPPQKRERSAMGAWSRNERYFLGGFCGFYGGWVGFVGGGFVFFWGGGVWGWGRLRKSFATGAGAIDKKARIRIVRGLDVQGRTERRGGGGGGGGVIVADHIYRSRRGQYCPGKKARARPRCIGSAIPPSARCCVAPSRPSAWPRTRRTRAPRRRRSRDATSVIDRMARKGLIHKNAAARYKSGLNGRLRTLAKT